MLKPISLNIIKTRWLLFALISAAILTFNILGFFWPDYLGLTNLPAPFLGFHFDPKTGFNKYPAGCKSVINANAFRFQSSLPQTF